MAAVEAGRDPFLQVGEHVAVNSQVHSDHGPELLPSRVRELEKSMTDPCSCSGWTRVAGDACGGVAPHALGAR